MIRRALLAIICLLLFFQAGGQNLTAPGNPDLLFTGSAGYATINELNAAFGLGNTSIYYSSFNAGISTLHGYQFNSHFTLSGGSGILFYNGGPLIPLMADFRYFLNNRKYAPYLCFNGGFMFNFNSVFKGYIDPGFGVRYAIKHNLGLTLTTGMLVQKDTGRDSFVNFRLGIVYKPGD